MSNEMREHVANLGRHGVTVCTASGNERLSSAFYDRIVRFCHKYQINGIAYEISVPETDKPMRLLIWKDGHVDSGSAENISRLLDNERRVFG